MRNKRLCVLIMLVLMGIGTVGCSDNNEIRSKSQDMVNQNESNQHKESELTVSELMGGERRIWFRLLDDREDLTYKSIIDSLIVTNDGKIETSWSTGRRSGLITLEDVDGLNIDETLETFKGVFHR